MSGVLGRHLLYPTLTSYQMWLLSTTTMIQKMRLHAAEGGKAEGGVHATNSDEARPM